MVSKNNSLWTVPELVMVFCGSSWRAEREAVRWSCLASWEDRELKRWSLLMDWWSTVEILAESMSTLRQDMSFSDKVYFLHKDTSFVIVILVKCVNNILNPLIINTVYVVPPSGAKHIFIFYALTVLLIFLDTLNHTLALTVFLL